MSIFIHGSTTQCSQDKNGFQIKSLSDMDVVKERRSQAPLMSILPERNSVVLRYNSLFRNVYLEMMILSKKSMLLQEKEDLAPTGLPNSQQKVQVGFGKPTNGGQTRKQTTSHGQCVPS